MFFWTSYSLIWAYSLGTQIGGGVCAYFKIDRNDNRKIFMLNDFNGWKTFFVTLANTLLPLSDAWRNSILYVMMMFLNVTF